MGVWPEFVVSTTAALMVMLVSAGATLGLTESEVDVASPAGFTVKVSFPVDDAYPAGALYTALSAFAPSPNELVVYVAV